MRLDVSGLRPTGSRGFYEVWMLRSPRDLVSLGTFKVDANGRADVELPVTVDAKRFPIVDVSVEPVDGNPAHSSISVLRSKPIVS
jgi:anti-sigma-K factor RskA